MKISITQYAKIRGISRQAILKTIKDNRVLQNVKKIEKVGNQYVLTVEKSFVEKNNSLTGSGFQRNNEKKL